MSVALYISVSIVITVLLVLLALLSKSMTKRVALPPRPIIAANVPQRRPVGRNETAGPGRRPAPRRRMVRTMDSDDDDEYNYDDNETRDMVSDIIEQSEAKMGAKKLRKMQEKAEKKANRESADQERLERKQREAMREAKRKEEDEKRKDEEARLAEEDRLIKEEEEKKKHEEYLKMKEMFSVEEEGEDEQETDLNAESLLQEFITYIKDMKVVLLEDLAAHFKIKTQDAIDRINALQESGDLTGVIDDRGKFIYITMDELTSVARFIEQRGRVSISELAESSNHLINLCPDNQDTARRLYQPITS